MEREGRRQRERGEKAEGERREGRGREGAVTFGIAELAAHYEQYLPDKRQ